MYYNCGIAIAKRQTKLTLHFTIQPVCHRGPAKTDYGSPDLSLTLCNSLIFAAFHVSGHPATTAA